MSEPGVSAADLSELLCFDIYAASRAMTTLYRSLLEEADLTYPQYLALVVLWRRGPLPVRDLCDALRLDYGTLTPLLQRLEAKGLVARTRRADDERSVLVSLTPAGEALRALGTRTQAAVRDATGLGARDTARLQAALRALATAVEPGLPAGTRS